MKKDRLKFAAIFCCALLCLTACKGKVEKVKNIEIAGLPVAQSDIPGQPVVRSDTFGLPVMQFDIREADGDFHKSYLSEWLEDYRVVALETTDRSLIGQKAKYFIGDSCILVLQPENILLFSRDGTFRREIARKGRGPTDYQVIEAYAVDEKSGRLYIIEGNEPWKIKSYHLQDSVYFRKIPCAEQEVYHMALSCMENGDLLLFPYPYNRARYMCYRQTPEGNVTDRIPFHFTSEAIPMGFEVMSRVGGEYRYACPRSDTIYSLTSRRVVPRWIFKNSEKRIYRLIAETSRYLLFSVDFIQSKRQVERHGQKVTETTGVLKNFRYDKETGELTGLAEVLEDILTQSDCLLTWHVTDGTQMYVAYPASTVMFYWQSENPLMEKIKGKAVCEKLKKTLTEEDNPVLLIGKFK